MSCNCGSVVKDERFHKIDAILEQTGRDEAMLIQILEQVQHELGYLPEEVQAYIAESLGIPLSQVYGVVTFYSLFTTEPVGKYIINICLGTACYVKGAERILSKVKTELGIDLGETTADGKFSIEPTRCLGACGLAPVFTINGEVYGKATVELVGKVLKEYKEKE